MKVKYYIVTVLLFCCNLLFAGEIKFTATVSKSQVATGEQFQITFSVNGNGGDFAPPVFPGFQILSGPNISTSVESINGNTTVSNAFSYILIPVKEGDFTIGAAAITVNGHRLRTNPVKIKVVKGRPVPQNTTQQTGEEGVAEERAQGDLSKLLFLRAVVDKNTVYEGQQLTVSYRLYTRVGIEESQPDKFPDLNGFFSEDIKHDQQQVHWSVETYKGQKFNVADIKQAVLFPQHDGNLTIDPLAMTFMVRQPVASNDVMEQLFGSFKEVKFKANSAPVIIHVKPLPATGMPPGFSGAVGDFKIEAAVDKEKLKANEALNYKVTIAGAGNIKLFKPLSVNTPAVFEKYDPKVTDTVIEDLEGVSGSRIYNYLLIPRQQGNYTIDPVKFSYFNPATGTYRTISTKAFQIAVEKGDPETNVTAFSADNRQDLKLLNKDIRYIKSDAGYLVKTGDLFFGSPLYYFLLFLGPLACLGAYNYRNYIRRHNSDFVKVKGRRAGKVAASHLANAQKQLSLKNTKAFYEDVFKGLYGYLSDKLNIPYANLDRETIVAALTHRQVDAQLIKRLLDTLDLCEMAHYAPVTHIAEQEVFEKAKTIINDIENEI